MFPVLGPTVAPLIGRRAQLRITIADLTKQTPSHISVVGPRYSGKTVFLHAVSNEPSIQGYYDAVVSWDLAHMTPDSDEQFLKEFASKIATALPQEHNAATKALTDAEAYSDVKEVMNYLGDLNARCLVLLDSFDTVLLNSKLTRQLWDQMLELAKLPSLRLVTGTRKPLSELIGSTDSAASDFWGVFDRNVRMRAFEECDLDEALERLAPIKVEKGARTELKSWTGLFPPLLLTTLNEIHKHGGEITNADISSIVVTIADDYKDHLASMWADFPVPVREAYLYLLEDKEIPLSKMTAKERSFLQDRGLIVVTGTKIKSSCRLMDKFAAEQLDDVGNLSRLFTAESDYCKNAKSVLELRLAQIGNINKQLKLCIDICIQDLPANPSLCMKHIRDVGDAAIQCLLDKELENSRNIPEDWFQYWRGLGYYNNNQWLLNSAYPRDRAGKVLLLSLIANPRDAEAKARYVSSVSSELTHIVKRLGDFGEHLDGETVPLQVALASVNICIELAAVCTNDCNRL